MAVWEKYRDVAEALIPSERVIVDLACDLAAAWSASGGHPTWVLTENLRRLAAAVVAYDRERHDLCVKL